MFSVNFEKQIKTDVKKIQKFDCVGLSKSPMQINISNFLKCQVYWFYGFRNKMIKKNIELNQFISLNLCYLN